MELTDFLLARIAEDEELARREPEVYARWNGGESEEALSCVDDVPRGRLLAECEAKRRIIDNAYKIAAQMDGEWGCCHNADEIRNGECPKEDGSQYGPEHLAAVYADHADYAPQWRP